MNCPNCAAPDYVQGTKCYSCAWPWEKLEPIQNKVVSSKYAFPFVFQKGTTDGVPDIVVDTGMSLRDWFAGMALQGMAASEHWCQNFDSTESAVTKYLPHVTKVAYLAADAMLVERERMSK